VACTGQHLSKIVNESALSLSKAPNRFDTGWLDGLAMRERLQLLPGVLLSAVLALVAIRLGTVGWLQAHGLSALTAAIVLGIVLGNTIYPRVAVHTGTGVAFSKQTLLRAGVILYGLRLTLHDIGQVGVTGVLTDALLLSSTFVLAVVAGTRFFGLDSATAMLIGAGNAICGAAAVMATGPLLRARADQVTVAISTVVVFGTLAIFLYPALYALNLHWHWLPAGSRAFGIYAGSTIHEVAQVFAAGRSISVETANTAVITKMVRVMLLAPFLIALSAWLARGSATKEVADGKTESPRKLTMPWFALAFVAMILFNSLALLPPTWVADAVELDTFLLAMAMGALGLTTHLSAIRRAGAQPLILGALLFVWLVAGGALVNRLVAG
jgi:uncharacterized integral membrane protein (TIGR00698 family)